MATSSDNAAQQARPALLIGLGGTGKQVLLNLRRMFYDHYGTTTLPHLGHLWIDTDTRSRGIDGEELDFLLKEVDFEEKEKVGTQLERADLANYYAHPHDYPHVFGWFDLDLKKHGEIKDGAGQIRSFGRLAFVHHYKDIKTTVRAQVDRITSVAAQNQSAREFEMAVDVSNWDAWVIFSVAGGTGSGMFLDMVFALRSLNPNLNIRGILVLPSIFSSDTSLKIYGNAYAALMELEHYNYAKAGPGTDGGEGLHLFRPVWTRDDYDQAGNGLRGPVFDACYILGNRPRSGAGGVDIADKNAYCEMLAEFLFIEYGGRDDALAMQWRGARSNYTNALTSTVSHGYEFDGQPFRETWSVAYSSFGLSKLFIPVDRVYTQCIHRLALDLIDHWTRPVDPPRDLDRELKERLMPSLGVADEGNRHQILEAIDWSGNRGERLSGQVRQRTADKLQQWSADPGRDDLGQLIQVWYRKEMLDGLLLRSDAAVDRWGGMATTINQNAEQHFKKVRAALDELIRDQLDRPERRFDSTRELLRRLNDELGHQEARFLEQETKTRGAGARIEEEIASRLAWLQDGGSSFTRRTIIKVVAEFIERRLLAELRAQVYGEAAQLVRRLREHIGKGETIKDAQDQEVIVESGLLKQVTDLREDLLRKLRPRVQERFDAFRKPMSALINQNLYDEADFQRVYTTERDQPIGQGFLGECERGFYEEYAGRGVGSLWALRQVLAQQGVDRLLRLLLTFTRQRTRYMEDRSASAIRRLSERYPPTSAQYQAAVRRLLDFSQPWLAEPTHHLAPNLLEHLVSDAWIAREEDPHSDLHRHFDDSLARLTTGQLNRAATAPDRVYAGTELAAFPLCAIPDVHDYRDKAYLPRLQKGEVLHIDLAYEKFQDLMPKTPDELRLQLRALKALIQGVLLRIIDYDDDDDLSLGQPPAYHFTSQAALFPQRVVLGTFPLALRKLAARNNSRALEEIEHEVARRVDAFREAPRARWVALLLFFGGEHRSSPNRKLPQAHQNRVAVRQLALEQLQRAPTLKEQAVKELDHIEQWALERPAGSGLRVFERMV